MDGLGEKRAPRTRPRIAVILVFLAGALASVVAYRVGLSFEDARIQASFERNAGERIAGVQSRISSTTGSLRALASFFEASGVVEPEQFGRFVSPLLSAYPGVQAYEWVPLVAGADRAAFERRAARATPGFRILERNAKGEMAPAGVRDKYLPVFFVEPLKGNERAVGFDLASNEARRVAMEAAIASRSPRATARITLVQETGDQYGFLLFVPVFKESVLQGLVLGVFRIGDVVGYRPDQIVRDHALDISIWDLSATREESLLFPKSGAAADISGGAISTSRELDVGGRTWKIVASATPAYVERERGVLHWALVAACLLLTVNIAWILERRFAVEAQVVARTAEIRLARDEAEAADTLMLGPLMVGAWAVKPFPLASGRHGLSPVDPTLSRHEPRHDLPQPPMRHLAQHAGADPRSGH